MQAGQGRSRVARYATHAPTKPITAKTTYSHRAAMTVLPWAVLTTTPARPAPYAPAMTTIVLMAAAAAGPSASSSMQCIDHADRCGHAAPIPIPVIVSASAHVTTRPADALSNWVAAARPRPNAMTSGPNTTTRLMTFLLLSDALRTSLTAPPTAKAAPRNPAATGTRCARRCPNSGTYMSTIAEAISTARARYFHFNGPFP